jgi:xanthine dehydrogenase accessory factor
MSADTEVWVDALRLAERGESFVVATVIATEGSSPRNTGAKMIWRVNGDQNGTVGGGQFEHMVLDAAAEHHRNRSSGIEHFVLGADADQCCGGTMDVYFEYHGARQRVVLFGAGHVAKETADLLAPSPLSLTIVDDRPEWNSEDRFPHAARIHSWDDGVGAACVTPASTLVCVMTCSHDTDFELLRSLLASETPAFVGLIGSKSKRACLFRRLVASGAPAQSVESVHCPIGLGDMGKEPRLVAISISGQLLLEAKNLAVL